MQHLVEQLSVLLTQDKGKTKTNGTLINLLNFSNNNQWILDSGATDHVTENESLLHNIRKYDIKQYVMIANGERMKIIRDDSIKIYSTIISKVWLVKNCTSNLLSIQKVTNELNCKLIFSSTNVIFQELISKKVIGEGLMENGLYYLDHKKLNLNIRREDQLSTLWHRRIGHPSDKCSKKIFDFSNIDNSSYEIYKIGKSTKLPFNISSCKSEKPFDLIHSDVWGPTPIVSFNGYKYFVLFIDDFCKTIWLYLLKNKSEVFNQF
jgi:hypothetical protein